MTMVECHALYRTGTASVEERCFPDPPKKTKSMLGTILLIILIIALLGGFRDWGRGPFYGTGYYGGGGLSLLLVIVLILVATGRV
jgi:Protein of unknown function (DUF3309)